MNEPIHNNKESDGIHEQNLSFFVALDNLIILTSYSTHVASKLQDNKTIKNVYNQMFFKNFGMIIFLN